MRGVALLLALAGNLCPAGRTYQLDGHVVPESSATISLFAATTPFHTATLTDELGRFRFRALVAGEYTIAVFISGRGEVRQTLEVGPAAADAKGRIEVTIRTEDSRLVAEEALQDRAKVTARQLSIPESAHREYQEAEKKLTRREVEAAVAHLEKAIRIAPQFSAAWNNLGTIAYQTRQYARAEEDFREALKQDPGSFEALVNLGGALLSEGKLDEALQYNSRAVLSRPNDALANSQLGLSYFTIGSLDLGQKYLEIARRIDPAHFSYPQLALAQIHLKRNERAAAAEEFHDFLRRHPDAPEAARVRESLAKLEQ